MALTPPTGPLPIGRSDLHLVDSSRQDPWKPDRARELMISVWHPARDRRGPPAAYMHPAAARVLAERLLKPIGSDPSLVDLAQISTHAVADGRAAAGRYPVVLYSPGGTMPRAVGATLIEDLASHGYVVVAIDHTFESPAVTFPDGRTEFAVPLPAEDGLRRMIDARIADTSFVLDALGRWPDQRNRFAKMLDLTRVGMFGHSAGGFTALEVLGRDPRLKAAADLDGSLGYAMSKQQYGQVVEQGLAKPFLLMGAGLIGPQRRPHTHLDSADWRRLWERSTGWKRDVYLARGEHMAFADHVALLPQLANRLSLPKPLLTAAIGEAAPERMAAGQRAYLAAFFDLHLKGRSPMRFDRLASEHPDFAQVL